MAMQYDGKTYRNLQEQVAYLTAKWQQLADEIDEVRAQIPSKMIVEELPEEGDPLITYYVGPKGTEPNLYYEVWVWVQEEPDGPFVWRELEDTDQVDLSGYLQKVETASTNAKAYVKNADGTQGMIDAATGASSATAGYLVLRASGGHVSVPDTPTQSYHATSKMYVVDNFLAKQTGTTSYVQVYAKDTDGTNYMVNVGAPVINSALVRRNGSGYFEINPPTADNHPTTKKYVDDGFIAKQTASSTYAQVYAKESNGANVLINTSYNLVDSAIVRRQGTQILVPTTPINGNCAASKDYVDAAVGQLLYLHDIEIIVTVDATNKLFVKALWINGSPTAVASIDSNTFKKMYVQYGCFGVDVENGTPCAVTKKPDAFAYDDFDGPRQSYLYQYISGGSLVSGETDGSMSFTFTDTVISF